MNFFFVHSSTEFLHFFPLFAVFDDQMMNFDSRDESMLKFARKSFSFLWFLNNFPSLFYQYFLGAIHVADADEDAILNIISSEKSLFRIRICTQWQRTHSVIQFFKFSCQHLNPISIQNWASFTSTNFRCLTAIFHQSFIKLSSLIALLKKCRRWWYSTQQNMHLNALKWGNFESHRIYLSSIIQSSNNVWSFKIAVGN